MKSQRKQHFIPKVYLKYFSQNEDGKDLYVIHHGSNYNRRIQKKNSGDSIFWDKQFYTSTEFDDPLALELFFAREIEPNYPKIISIIKQERSNIDYKFKIELLHWIFYAKLRSPVFRTIIADILIAEGYYIGEDIEKSAKAAHLAMFHDKELFDKISNNILYHLASKKWTILKTRSDSPFWTSDSPGFGIDLDSLEKNLNTVPSSFWHNRHHDTLFFFPLTKDYTLQIGPFPKGTPLDVNITNSPVLTERIDSSRTKIINFWTLITSTMIICNTPLPLNEIEEINIAQDAVK